MELTITIETIKLKLFPSGYSIWLTMLLMRWIDEFCYPRVTDILAGERETSEPMKINGISKIPKKASCDLYHAERKSSVCGKKHVKIRLQP